MSTQNQLLKNHLNIVEAPVRPFIQKLPPRFVWAGRQKTVNVGEILRNQETNTQSYDNAVLAVSKMENQQRYGQRSYTPKVNKAFRPPLMDPEFDLRPLSRLPRPRTQARVNPGGNGTIYHTQNTHGMDVSALVDDRRLFAAIRPDFGIKMEKPTDYEIVPDLEYNMPQTCGTSRGRVTAVDIQPENEIEYLSLDYKDPEAFAHSGVQSSIRGRNTSALEDLLLDEQTPTAFATSGVQHDTVRIHNYENYENMELEDNNPRAMGYSRVQGPHNMKTDTSYLEDLELRQKVTGRDIITNPGSRVDTISYEPSETRTIDRVSAGCSSGVCSINNTFVNNTPTHDRQIRPKLTEFGGYDPSRTGGMVPRGPSNVSLPRLKNFNRPLVEGVRA